MARTLRIALSDLPIGGKKPVEDGDAKALFIRDADGVRAFQATCPHYGAPLAKGELCGSKLYCPWHKAVFDVGDGMLLEPPALKSLDRYPVTIEGDVAVASLEPMERETAALHAGKVFAIIGTGAAAVAAATTLRRKGFAGTLIMIGAEKGQPYDRPQLSKSFLAKQTPPDATLLEPDFYAAHDITFINQRVTHVAVTSRTVTLEGGEVIVPDALLIATGSRAVLPDLAGSGLAGVFTLRSLRDAVAISDAAAAAKKVVMIGGGFIGLEAAAFLTKRGLAVTVVSSDALPLASRFGEAVAAGLKRFHESNGVTFVQATVSRLDGTDHVGEACLEDGRSLPADMVLLAVGAAPETGFIEGIAKREDGGIDVDAKLSIAPSVYLAGDIAAASVAHQTGKTRIEHWRLAQQQGAHVAGAMLGSSSAFGGTPYFWSNQGAKRLDYVGFAKDWDRIIMRGSPETLDFIAFYIKDDQAHAACAVGHNSELIAFLDALDEGCAPKLDQIEDGALV